MHTLGAHLSIAGGHINGLTKLQEIGGNCLQIFSSSPRQWIDPKITDEQIADFRKKAENLQISHIYFHATYLINLADSGRIGAMSKKSLSTDMMLASAMNIRGVVIHLGSFTASQFSEEERSYETLIKNCKEVLSTAPKDVLFIIENAGTKKIGATFDEIGQIIKDLDDPRVRVCVDTCHSHAAGYDLSTKEKLEGFLNLFDSLIGISKLELFHCNDSKDPLGAFRDRHENIGEGKVGLETVKLLLNHETTKQLPFILEVPGYDKKGPDKKNIDTLLALSS